MNGPEQLKFLEELRKIGVKHAKIGAGEVHDVEFFGAEQPIPVSDGAIDAATRQPESDGSEGYEMALSQMRNKRFEKQGGIS